MSQYKVLWIEDDADNDLYHLASPVIIDGRYDLDIATNASEAHFHLNVNQYDVVIVDIRIPPGKDEVWQNRSKQLEKKKEANSNRLGLELLRCIFDRSEAQPEMKVDKNLSPERYGVFTVEQHDELKPDLEQLRLEKIKYQQKNAMMPYTALLDFILKVFDDISLDNSDN